jgi:uncharacterized protein YjiS (DUF1127 family)
MTTLTLDTTASRPHRLRLRNLTQAVAEWRRRSRSRAELMSFTHRGLLDIGVSRDTALCEASKPFWIP